MLKKHLINPKGEGKMKITPINNIKPITFGEGNLNNITPKVGLLSLQNSDNLNFEKNLKLTQDADAVQSNPLKAIGCKLTKAYNILFTPNQDRTYRHIPYMA